MNEYIKDDCIELDVLGWYFTVLLFVRNINWISSLTFTVIIENLEL